MQTRMLTLQDTITYFYQNAAQPSMSGSFYPSVTKGAGIINTGLGLGVWNPIYGAQAWYQINTESNLFSAMPKFVWDKSGFRMINGYTRSASSMGITETATLPSPTYPTIQVVKINPKQNVNTFQVTQVVQQLATESQDDIYGNLDTIRGFYATEHGKLLNEQIGTLAVGTSPATSSSGASILTLESLDRIVSSYGEGVSAGLSATSSPTLADVIDPYYGAFNRSAGGSIFDSYVVSGATPLTATSTTLAPAALTDATIRQSIQGGRKNGANPTVMLTGYETYALIQGLYVDNIRYFPMSETSVKFNINGIETGEGMIGGMQVPAVYGLPLIQAVNTPVDKYGYERLFMLDTSDTEGYGYGRLGVSILNPTTYLETTNKDFLFIQQLGYEAMFYTFGEVICRFPAAQVKIRDITG